VQLYGIDGAERGSYQAYQHALGARCADVCPGANDYLAAIGSFDNKVFRMRIA
jgi:hypothetical protein